MLHLSLGSHQEGFLVRAQAQVLMLGTKLALICQNLTCFICCHTVHASETLVTNTTTTIGCITDNISFLRT